MGATGAAWRERVLRLVDRPVVGRSGEHRVSVTWSGSGRAPVEAEAVVDLVVDAAVEERVRWYVEDYAEFPLDPAPTVAVAAERDLTELGHRLFTAVFGAGDGARIWAQATLDGLAGVRVEVDDDPAHAPGLPWELLRDPGSGRAVVLDVGQFVRTHRRAVTAAAVPAPGTEELRLLLVIARPGGADDVPFRSVASRLVRAGADRLDGLHLEVLRPATYDRLADVLRDAHRAGRPFQVVHFDGHGTYADPATLTTPHHDDSDSDDGDSGDSEVAGGSCTGGAGTGGVGGAGGTGRGGGGAVGAPPLSPYMYTTVTDTRAGRHGYLLFEDPATATGTRYVSGPELAGLLRQTGAGVLVLNACRSAYTEAPDAPRDPSGPGAPGAPDESVDAVAEVTAGPAGPAGPVGVVGDVHARVRAYGSLAAEVADAGVAGVVAMRFNVYVVTAAQFVADLYTHLLSGQSLGQAATLARQQLADDPTRVIGGSGDSPVVLQDWVVPTVYEAVPLTLFERPTPTSDAAGGAAGAVPRLVIGAGDTGDAGDSTAVGHDKVGVPRAPDGGFFGRDETLLALDRVFDTYRVVLLSALAGAGKTTTAAEFTRWYHATGGLAYALPGGTTGDGVVLWSSFEHHLPLERLLDTVGVAFAGMWEANGIHWAAVTDPAQRRDLVLQVLAQVPVVWVWDNVEPVAGFPTGTPSAWTATEQAELAAFLRDLRDQTRTKVLLTSRRDEHLWLGDLPVRLRLPPMPMRERLQLAHALAGHLTGRSSAVTGVDWKPLLRFTGGNPLTITVTVRQAVRTGHATDTTTLGAFVERVRAGTVALEPATDAALGRDASLAASLDYGFTHAFTPPERARLALLHLFHDTIDVDALTLIGATDKPGEDVGDAVPAVAGLTREDGIALLDRAVEVGLLTGYGGGYYGIHPALPWYFTALFAEHVGVPGSPPVAGAERAYARAYATLGRDYFNQVEAGNAAGVLPALRLEEANLVHAWHLARRHHLLTEAAACLLGLKRLYGLTGRDIEWARLVAQAFPDYIDPATDLPRPGHDDLYGGVMQWRVQIARDRRDLAGATRLQTTALAWDRDRAAPHLATATATADFTPTARHLLRNLAVAEQDTGRLLREQGDPACLPHLHAHHDLFEQVGDTADQARAANQLGIAYMDVSAIRDLDQAEHWHRRELALKPAEARIGRAAALGSLANVASERFLDARTAGEPEQVLLGHLNTALQGHQDALSLVPADHHDYRAVAHNQIGNLYSEVGDVRPAIHHYQRSLHHVEIRGDHYGAAQTRFNIALLFAGAGRPHDALAYAHAAHATYLTLGPDAAPATDRAAQLIRDLEEAAPDHPDLNH